MIMPSRDIPNGDGRADVPYELILLAGALRPSPLRQQLDLPVLTLPLTAEQTLLDRWLTAVDATPGCRAITIVMSSERDAGELWQVIESIHERGRWDTLPPIDVVVDPQDWRGPAGLLRDIALREGALQDECLIVGEAACLPPADFSALLNAFGPTVGGVIAGTNDNEPAGVYAFSSETINLIPAIGFFDLKEQFIPELRKAGRDVLLVRTRDDLIIRARTREGYLHAVRWALSEARLRHSYDSTASIARRAHLTGTCLLMGGAEVADDAIVHESVLLPGARLESGAVVSHCIIGPHVTVESGRTLRREILATPFDVVARRAINGDGADLGRRRFRLSSLLRESIGGSSRA